MVCHENFRLAPVPPLYQENPPGTAHPQPVLRILYPECKLIKDIPGQSTKNRRKKVSSILVTLTSHSDSDFKRSNVSLKENKPDGVNPNSNDIDYYVRKNEGNVLWFSAGICGNPVHSSFQRYQIPTLVLVISKDFR